VGVALLSDPAPVLVAEAALALSVATWEFPTLLILAVSVGSEEADVTTSLVSADEIDTAETEEDPVKAAALSLITELETEEAEVLERDAEADMTDELELGIATEVLLADTEDWKSETLPLLESTWEALELPVELPTCETEALELLTTDCELKLTDEEETADEDETTDEDETADEELIKLALLDMMLEMADPDDELTACAGAAYRLTSVVFGLLAWTEAARITRRRGPSKLTTAIWTRLWPSICAEQVIPSLGSNEQVRGTESSLLAVLSKTL
jgi:hypothetical protein